MVSYVAIGLAWAGHPRLVACRRAKRLRLRVAREPTSATLPGAAGARGGQKQRASPARGLTRTISSTRRTGRSGARSLTGCVVKLAILHAVEKTFPFMPVVDENPAIRVTGHAHEYPLASGRRIADKGDLDGTAPITRTPPGLHTNIDAQPLHGWLSCHGASLPGHRCRRHSQDRRAAVTVAGRPHSRASATRRCRPPAHPQHPIRRHEPRPGRHPHTVEPTPGHRRSAPPRPSSEGAHPRPRWPQ